MKLPFDRHSTLTQFFPFSNFLEGCVPVWCQQQQYSINNNKKCMRNVIIFFGEREYKWENSLSIWKTLSLSLSLVNSHLFYHGCCCYLLDRNFVGMQIFFALAFPSHPHLHPHDRSQIQILSLHINRNRVRAHTLTYFFIDLSYAFEIVSDLDRILHATQLASYVVSMCVRSLSWWSLSTFVSRWRHSTSCTRAKFSPADPDLSFNTSSIKV